MNPDYAGRTNVPYSFELLFRCATIMKPDLNMIMMMALYKKGFKQAETLSVKLVAAFK